MFEVMYSNSFRWHNKLQVEHFVTLATYGVMTHLAKPVLKGTQSDPHKRSLIIKHLFYPSFVN